MAQRLNHQKGGMLNLSLSKGSTLRFSCRPQDAVSQLLRCLRMGVGGSYARTGTPQAAPSATYNVNNQLTQWKGASLTYDANGNLTSDGTNTYTWNARNQLVSVSGPVPASFQYDPFGRRVSKTIGGTTQYLYDGANPVQEISGTSASANLLTGGEDEYLQRTDSAGARSFLTDALGSTLALADSTGALQTQYTFEPFGNTSTTGTATANSFAYTGRELDATGLYFYRARYYNPSLQRFISEDPIGLAGGDVNFYSYLRSYPINLIDPFGWRPGDKYPSRRCAGWNAENDYDPISRRRNLEYGGFIYHNADGTFSYTDPSANNNAGIGTADALPHFWDITIPAGTQRAGWYHTHAAFDPGMNMPGNPAPGQPGYNWHNDGNEVMSPDDMHISEVDLNGLPGYLGTPRGTIEEYI